MNNITIPANFIKAQGDIRVRYNNSTHQVLAWNPECDRYIIDSGELVKREETTLCNRFTATAQTYEWYGDEDHVGDTAHGRHKPKGGTDFILWLTDTESLYEKEETLEKLNAKYNRKDRFTRFEFDDFHPNFFEPVELTIKDGEFEGW